MVAKLFARWVMNHRITSIVLIVLSALVLGLGGINAEFSANQRDFFRADDVHLNNLVQIEDEFTSDKNVLVLIEPKNKDIFDPTTLSAIREITKFGWKVPYSQRVESITNHLYTQVEGDELLVEYLFDEEVQLSTEERNTRKTYAVNKVGLEDYLITHDGDIALVSVTLNLPSSDSANAAIEVVDHVRAGIDGISQEYPDINFRVLGAVVMEVSIPKIVQEDGQTTFPIATFIVFIFLTIVLRDLVGNVIALTTSFLAITAGMGGVLWTGVKLSPILINSPAIIIILAMADCIHLMVNYSQGLANNLDKKTALQKSIEVNFAPIIFTSLTTALSFLALNFSDSPPFAHMGTASAIGILFAMIASLTFLPAAIYYLPSKAKGVSTMPKLGGLVPIYQKHGNLIIVAFTIVIISLSAFIPKNILDDNFIEFFDETLEVRKDIDFLTDNIGGSAVVNISIPATEQGGILEPEYLTLLDELDSFLSQQPELRFTTSLLEVMKTLNRNMHNDDPEWYRVPETRNLASQYLLMYEMSLPFGQDLNNLMNFDRSESRVIAVYDKLSDKNLITLETKLQKWLDERNLSDVNATIGSSSLAFAHMQFANVNNLSKGFVFALLAISALLILMFRSFTLGAISVIPNLFPAAMAFGIWALIDGKIGFGMSVGITLTLGIVVDDTIHFLSKYQYAKDSLGYSNENAVRYAMDTVGIAMMLTTVMMSVGFGSMLFSNFTPNQDIAAITIITIICAVFVDLILLPIILLKIYGKSEPIITPNLNQSMGAV
ncbi:MAG: MMPL family transporter [Pseudomonadales bacterium]|nr:MMPL family transporter [Pseudomonadales bacterium]